MITVSGLPFSHQIYLVPEFQLDSVKLIQQILMGFDVLQEVLKNHVQLLVF